MAGQQWARRVFTDARTAPRMLSLHSNDPGNSGAAQIDGPFMLRASDLMVIDSALMNSRDIEIGPVRRAGRVVYAGIWTTDRAFIVGIRLQQPQDVRAGQRI